MLNQKYTSNKNINKKKHRNHSKIYYPNISLAFENFHLVLPAYAGL